MNKSVFVANVDNNNMDTVVSKISVNATSKFTVNCSAHNEIGTVSASHDIDTCEFLFSDYMIFSTLYVYFVYEYC